ncbi:M60 family metallopeptidase [Pontiella sp.]|uniref:M60 family metallopeptidase n=1 Tax=Pontiella sp. TaxID=2837462 RepID=UPI00356A800C
MKQHGLIVLLGLTLVSPVWAKSGMLERARDLVPDVERFGSNANQLKEAFELVEEFEAEAGPLFLTPKTKNGLPRQPSAKLELEQAMFAIQQGLIDYAYTPDNLKKQRSLFDGAGFKTAAYFPGPVDPPKDPKKIYTVTVNASQPTAWGSPVAGRDGPARRATGCYLAPGCVAEVAVPKALVNKGYTIRVGAHSWDLVKKNSMKRLDRVSLVFPVTESRTLIANPLGGGIYLEVPYEADAGVVEIQLRNVVRSPFYSARSFEPTSSSDWKKERTLDAPWADFESDKFMMQVPSAWIRDLQDPATLMADWDKAMDAISELFGHPLERSKHVLYMQADVIMRGSANFPGYPQSNYPYNAHNPEQCRHGWMIKGPQFANWTVFHEVGHSQFFSKFRGEVEAVVNLPHVAVKNRMFGWSLDQAFGEAVSNMKHLTLDEVAVMWMVTENFRQGREMNHSNRPGDEFKYQHRGFGKYVEIVNLFGWDALSRFWKMDNERFEPGDKVPQNNDPVDDRILRLSIAAGADVTPLIHFWGIQPQNPKALAKAIRKEGLKPSPEIFQRLEHYKTIIPMSQSEFEAHSKRVYPGGLKNAKNPLYGPGWYKAQLSEYDEAAGRAAQAALQDIIELYFQPGA